METTIIVTTANEPDLAEKCVQSILESGTDLNDWFSIMVIAPDDETLSRMESYGVRYVIKDEGKGKIAAMNKALELVSSEVVIWTDGDCEVENLLPLVEAFEDPDVGAAGGSVHPKRNGYGKWGFFHKFLTDAANEARERRADNREFIELSGYLWAFRRDLVTEIPYNAAEDSIVPLAIYNKGWKIAFVPESKVYVSGPRNFKDWMKQKSRAAKAHEKLHDQKGKEFKLMKTFRNEVVEGMSFALSYDVSWREFFWLLQLVFMRGWMWLRIKFMPDYADGWQPVESTKV